MRFQLERFAFWLVRSAARIWPRSFVLFLGRVFGRIAFFLDARHRAVALENFRLAFPNTEEATAHKTVAQCYSFLGSYLFDLLTFFPRFRSERMKDYEFEGLDYLREAYDAGKGVICFGGHYGAWEIMALAHGYHGFSLGDVVRRLDNPYLEDLLSRLRTSTGNFIIDKRAGFRPMLKALREKRGIALLIDQNVTTSERIFVDFFGRPAATTPALALLKIKTDAALVPAIAMPMAGNRYRFIYGPPLQIALTGSRDKDVRRITQECTTVLEDQIRKYPQYWLWMHRRWKTRPEDSLPSEEPLRETVME